jgi:hypothetical protein
MLRQLGYVLLCGVLHVAYQTTDCVNGQYMICILYPSSLVLAIPSKGLSTYEVVAVISLANASIESSDNGRGRPTIPLVFLNAIANRWAGLQCYTAPYTFKLAFEFERRNYEFILSACSEKEEDEWKAHLRQQIAAEMRNLPEGRSHAAELFSSLNLNVKALGTAFEALGVFTRRKSIHRAATLGPKTNLHQVIIKNTHAQKTGGDENALPVVRSQSHLSSSHVPTLAPRRAERIKMEAAMGDVWSKDILPYPGMASRRMETHIRASANSVMRKLSMASIASNFSKRSTSFANLSNHRMEEPRCSSAQRALPFGPPKLVKRTTGLEKLRNRTPVIVDFHNTPSAFLPEDFELKPKQNMPGKHRRLANRALTAGLSESSVTPRHLTPIGVYMDTMGENRSPSRAYSACKVQAPTTAPSSVDASMSSDRSEHTERKAFSRTASHCSRAASRADSVQENLAPPSFSGHRGPVKARSLLFKFLAMVKE